MTQVPIEAMRFLVRAKDVSKSETVPKAKPVIGVVHRALRTATWNDHASIDRMLLPFDLNRTEDYRIFLNIHFTALAALRAAWRLQDRDDFERMTRCVQSDLESLRCTPSTTPCIPHESSNPPKGLGIAYVVRGSRLGAAVLRRRVAREFPTSYLDFVPALSWTAFLLELESIADDPAARDEATLAARSAFNVFAREFVPLSGVRSTPLS
jgi:heme oxygenase